MTVSIGHLQPIIALLAGILILVMPRLLNLIAVGIIGPGLFRSLEHDPPSRRLLDSVLLPAPPFPTLWRMTPPNPRREVTPAVLLAEGRLGSAGAFRTGETTFSR